MRRQIECNDKCDPEKNIHWFGDRFFSVKKCSGCGESGKPHVGFGFSCPASSSGAHYTEASNA